MDAGSRSLDVYRAKLAETQIEQVGARLRALEREGGDRWRRLTSRSPCWATAPSAPRSTACSTSQADDIERATGHRLRVVKALVRDLGKEREYPT